MGSSDLEFTIVKFKAMDSLDFIIDLISYLPETISLPDGTPLKRETVKYIIFMLMDVGVDVKIDQAQKDIINDVAQLNLIDIIFKESYANSNLEMRKHIRTQLISLLRMENGGLISEDIDIFLKSPKAIFAALTKVVKFNYDDFFLTAGEKSL